MQPEREPGVDARAITSSRPASSCPTGAGAASTTAPTSAARSISPASTPTPPAGRTRSPSSRATATSRSSRSRSAPTSRTTGRCGPACRSSFGLRYDWQNYFHDNNNVAPRFSVAYAPGNKKTNVLRAGIGVFNDRSGPVVIADVLHSQPGGLIKIRDHGSRLSRSVRIGGRRGVARRRASCGSRPTCRFRRRCSTASASIISCRRRRRCR